MADEDIYVKFNLKNKTNSSTSKTKKTKEKIKSIEMKMKVVDKEIERLKQELYENVSTLRCLKLYNKKAAELIETADSLSEAPLYCTDMFKSFQDALNQNTHFKEMINILKNEMYRKPDVNFLDEETLIRCVTSSEKAVYSQWILKTITDKLSKKSEFIKNNSNSSLEAMSYLRKFLSFCNIPVTDIYPATLNTLNNMPYQTLSDAEQDLLIFMHTTARMQSIIELMEKGNIKQDNSQILISKAEQREIQKYYLKHLNKLKILVSCMEKIPLSKVFDAIAKSYDTKIEAEEISEVYENFKSYVTCASGEINENLTCFKNKENLEFNHTAQESYKELGGKVEKCTEQITNAVTESFNQLLMHKIFEKAVNDMLHEIKEFVNEILNMTINSIENPRKHLNCIKPQIKSVLRSKWALQKYLLVSDLEETASAHFQDTKQLYKAGRSKLLFEHIRESMFNLKLLEEIEFNESFSVMSSLCELRGRKDLLVQKFRNFVVRIRHQKIKHLPSIKNDLFHFNKEIQMLYSDFQKLRLKLQFLQSHEENNVKNVLEDIDDIIVANDEFSKDKKSVGVTPVRRLKSTEVSKSVQKETKNNLEEIYRSIDETKEFLLFLDESIISKKFSAMRYLCELHCIKKQILSSFQTLLSSLSELNIEDDDAIIRRLSVIDVVTENLIKKYEVVGMQLMLFSDVMEIVYKEKSNYLELAIGKENEIKISDLFGPSEDVRRLHFALDNAVRNKWFPAKQNLLHLFNDKERIVHSFKKFLESMPKLDVYNALDVIHSLKEMVMNAESLLRRYQSLRMQLIWIDGDCVFRSKNV